MTTHYVSLSHENKFSFTCPVFNAETRMGACVELRDITMGGGVFPKRKGCQAAIKCSMCPAAAMVSMYWQNKNWKNDHHGSLEPKKGRLHAQVLERVARVMAYKGFYKHIDVSAREEELLQSAGERIREQLKTAPGETTDRFVDLDDAPKRRAKPKAAAPAPKTNDALSKAAQTGDMSAALNAA
jgi:hypothetical protein